ncbi:MAG: MFS transporter [Myxococcota bacterium]
MRRWWPWCAATLLLLWQVDFQFTYGFVADAVQNDVGISAAQATAVSSVFLLAYGAMQLPAGLLIDRFGVRWVLPIAGWAAAGAVLWFARSQSFVDLASARVFAGAFMAFMFPAAGKIARIKLPAARFALAMALADMCLGIGAVTAGNMATLITRLDWRSLMTIHAAVGVSIATIVAVSLRGMPRPSVVARDEPSIDFLVLVTKRRVVLAAGLYAWGAGLAFAFGGYWNLRLQAACHCTAPQVSALSTALFAGLAIGMLASGVYATSASKRRIALRVGTVATLILLAWILWKSATASFGELVVPMVLLGAGLGTSALSFAVAIPGIPKHQAGTVVAVVNAAGCLGGALLQELPIWLGGDTESLDMMRVIYVITSVVGVLLALRLRVDE